MDSVNMENIEWKANNSSHKTNGGKNNMHSNLYKEQCNITPKEILDQTITTKSGFNQSQIINIPDANLKRVIQNVLSLNSDDNITADDMAKLKSFSAASQNIKDLEGMQYAINLQQVSFDYNPLENLSPLNNLTNLSDLYLQHTNITNLADLTNLPNLVDLRINYNNIKDISSINNFSKLTVLGADSNQIDNISSLSSLKAMQQFSFVGNNISDISVVQYYPEIQGVWASNNPINDISILGNKNTLQVVQLANINTSDFTPLATLSELKRVDLSKNNLSDISFLKNSANNLYYVFLQHNNLTDITPLSGTKNIGIMGLDYNNQLEDFSPLLNNHELAALSLSGTKIENIDFINPANFPKLSQLYLASNHISDLSPLSALSTLSLLTLESSSVQDVSFLKAYSHTTVYLNYNNITNLKILSNTEGVKCQVNEQTVSLPNVSLGHETPLDLFSPSGIPAITWITPGQYDGQNLIWQNLGNNQLSWQYNDDKCEFSGDLLQFVDHV